MPRIDVRHEMHRLAADIGVMRRDVMPRTVAALNRAMTIVSREAVREIAPGYPGLANRRIRSRIKRKRASIAKPAAALDFSATRVRWILFRVSRKKTKYGTGIRKTGKLPWRMLLPKEQGDLRAEDLQSAFFAYARRAGGNIWLRTSASRMPIRPVLVASISEYLRERGINDRLRRSAQAHFSQQFRFPPLAKKRALAP